MENKESASVSETSEYENDEEENESNFYPSKRSNSFVWKYFRAVDSKTYECVICLACNVGNQTSNLARHLSVSHNITCPTQQGIDSNAGRRRRSFIWKYCKKEDSKHARCHFCNKLLYFGCGNTSNISKHLRRKHQHLIEDQQDNMDETENNLQDSSFKTLRPSTNGELNVSAIAHSESERKERKGGSYVWKYCDRVSRESVRCNLCNKLMSFHGTANVITHLQRRHNIVGKIEGDNVQIPIKLNLSETLNDADDLDETDSHVKHGRRTNASSSIVWKYCTRISKEAVRCGFCKKNLSYQGTSNLQRHLHRMHGVVMQPRNAVDNSDPQLKDVDSNFIWEHCTLNNNKAKCNMCGTIFEGDDTTTISKHLTFTHSLETVFSGMSKRRKLDYDTSDDENENWSKHGEAKNDGFEALKKDESNSAYIYEGENDRIDEDPFYTSALQEIPLENPLSPDSTLDGSRSGGRKHVFESKKMQELKEERVRMETECFREKTEYYRMQKYLTALQAKKLRMELEQMTKSDFNGVDIYPEHLSTQ